MKKNFKSIKTSVIYSLLSIVIAFVLYSLYGLPVSELNIPIRDIYSPGDGRLTLAVFKMIVAEEWTSLIVPFTPHLNAPFVYDSYDFPQPFFAEFLYIKLLSIFSTDSAVVFNLYYLSTYFLNAFTMYWVLRRFRVYVLLAIAGSLIFTFLPYHYWRLPHTFYAGYFFIPLWIYYLLLLTNKKPLFFKKKQGESKYSFDWSKRNIIIILVLLISSTWNFYYTFFFSFLIGFTLLSNFIYRNSKHHILSTLIFFSLAIAPFAANMLPYKAYEIENGKNHQVGIRVAVESETLGLTIATLIMPSVNHQIKYADELGRRYHLMSMLYNESNDGTLGVFGAIGFGLLIFVVFIHNKFNRVLTRLAYFTVGAVLLSTAGGFGTIFAFLVSPQIRAYNRISMFVAAMSLIALMLFINKYVVKNKITKFLVPFFIAVFGLFDIIGKEMSFEVNQKLKTEYLSDQGFIQKIESQFDVDNEKIMIAQLPYLNFPENPGGVNMGNYEQFQGYIHSDKLYWSFGSMKGRGVDSWWKNFNTYNGKSPLKSREYLSSLIGSYNVTLIKNATLDLRKISSKLVAEQVKILQEAGFSGIMINRNGHKDNAENIESNLTKLLGSKPMVSENKILSFYRLSPTSTKVMMLKIVFNGFYQWEGEPGKFRWAGNNANISLYNDKDSSKTKSISFTLGTLRDRGMVIKLNGQTLEQFEMQSGLVTNHSYSLQLKPGQNTLKFETMEPARSPGGADNRKLAFNIGEFVLGGHAK